MTIRRWNIYFAALVAATSLAASCSTDSGVEAQPALTPTTAARPQETSTPSMDEEVQLDPGPLPGVTDYGWEQGQRQITDLLNPWIKGDLEDQYGTAPLVLGPGAYSSEQLGTPMTISTDEPIRLRVEAPGAIVIDDPAFERPGGGPALLFLRPSGVATPSALADPRAGDLRGLVSDPLPEDFIAWLQALDQTKVSEPVSGTIGGYETHQVTVTVNATSTTAFGCILGPDCVNLLEIEGAPIGMIQVFSQATFEFWEIEQPGTDIVLMLQAPGDTHEDELSRYQPLIDAIDFGTPVEWPESPDSDIQRRPWGAVESGDHRFIGLPDLRLAAEGQRFFRQVDGSLSVSTAAPGVPDVTVLKLRLVAETPVASTDELLAALADRGWTLQTQPNATVFGYDATRYSVELPIEMDVALYTPQADPTNSSDGYFFSQKHSQMWVLDQPDIGLWAIVAQAETLEGLTEGVNYVETELSNATILTD